MTAEAVRQFVSALSAAQWDDVQAALHPQVTFLGMTPRRSWAADSAHAVVADVLRCWFEDDDEIVALLSCEVDTVVDRYRVAYRLRVRNAAGLYLVDQQGYCDVDAGGRITRLQLMCAGFRPEPHHGDG